MKGLRRWHSALFLSVSLACLVSLVLADRAHAADEAFPYYAVLDENAADAINVSLVQANEPYPFDYDQVAGSPENRSIRFTLLLAEPMMFGGWMWSGWVLEGDGYFNEQGRLQVTDSWIRNYPFGDGLWLVDGQYEIDILP